MNNRIVLNCDRGNVLYETFENIWVKRPYKFCIGTKQPAYKIARVVHKEIELNMTTNGVFKIELNGKDISVNTGVLVVANSMVSHGCELDDETTIDNLIIDSKFLYENGIDITKYRIKEVIDDENVRVFFKQLSEQSKTDLLRDAVMKGLILQLMVYLIRHHAIRISDEEISENSNKFGQRFEYTKRAIDYIYANIHTNPNIDDISKHVGLTRYHFMRIFKSVTGYTVSDYIGYVKCEYAKKKLASGKSTVTETAYSLGFPNISYFAKIFKKHTGKLPSEYIAKNDKSNGEKQ